MNTRSAVRALAPVGIAVVATAAIALPTAWLPHAARSGHLPAVLSSASPTAATTSPPWSPGPSDVPAWPADCPPRDEVPDQMGGAPMPPWLARCAVDTRVTQDATPWWSAR